MNPANKLTVLVLLLIQAVTSAPLAETLVVDSDSAIKTVTQFKNESWIENLSVRSNGNVLVTRFDNLPILYEIDPLNGGHPRILADFRRLKDNKALSGIAEIEPDVFAFLLTQDRFDTVNNTLILRNGSTEVYKIDLNVRPKPALSLITTIENTGFPNGMSLIPGTDWLLVSDSLRGLLYRVNKRTGNHNVAIRDHLMTYPAGSYPPLGVNGVQVDSTGTFAYFANSQRQFIGRVPITPHGTANGPAKIFANAHDVVDDFTLDSQNIYAATNPGNTLLKISMATREVQTIAGNLNSSVLPGPTAAHFGRGNAERHILYVTCNGGLVVPINGTYIEGGSLKAIDLSKLAS